MKNKGTVLTLLLSVVLALFLTACAQSDPVSSTAKPVESQWRDPAEQKVIEANVRAIRAAAVTEVLTNNTGSFSEIGPWKAEATIDEDTFEVKDLVITDWQETDSESTPDEPYGRYVVKIEY